MKRDGPGSESRLPLVPLVPIIPKHCLYAPKFLCPVEYASKEGNLRIGSLLPLPDTASPFDLGVLLPQPSTNSPVN